MRSLPSVVALGALFVGYATVWTWLGTGRAVAQARCEVHRADYGFSSVRVTPEGGQAFEVGVGAHDVRIRYEGGRFAAARFRALLEFSGVPSGIDLRAGREVTVAGNLGRVAPGSAVGLVPAQSGARGREALQIVASFAGGDVRMGPIPVGCADLALGAPASRPRPRSTAADRRASREPDFARSSGARWIARSGSLVLRERPGGGRELVVRLAYADFNPVFELARRGDSTRRAGGGPRPRRGSVELNWVRVGRDLGGGSWFAGWVRLDAIAPYEEPTGGLAMMGRDRGAGCGGAADPLDEGELLVPARVPAGTAVFAAAGTERWATVVASTELPVRVRPGAEWARLADVAGIVEHVRGTECTRPLTRAFVRTDALAFATPLPAAAIAPAPAALPTAGAERVAAVRARLGLDRLGMLAVGHDFACTLRSGTPYCWGSNVSGALGDGTDVAGRDRAAPVPGVDDAVQIAASRSRTCVVRRSGALACWGGTSAPASGGVAAIAGITDAVSVALGSAHGCATRRDGRVACWGSNEHGALGDGTDRDPTGVVEVAGIGDAVQVVAGSRHTCVLRADGTASCWGAGAEGQLGDGSSEPVRRRPVAVRGASDLVLLSTGGNATCGLRRSGDALCWGSSADTLQVIPGARPPLREATVAAALGGAAQLAVGDQFGCVRRRDGTVRCWGDDRQGALGVGGRRGYGLREPVGNLASAVEVAAGSWLACARDERSRVLCWGPRTVHEPVAVEGVGPATTVTLGYRHGCALERTGALRCWGDVIEAPPALDAGWRVAAIEAGVTGTCAVGRDGRVRCGGEVLPVTENVRALSLDVYGGCALLRSGNAQCWGREVVDPTRFDGGDVEQIEVSGQTRCARMRNGRVSCWRPAGQDDPRHPVAPATPTAVAGIDDAEQIALAGYLSCARRRGGGTACWNVREPTAVEVPELIDAAWISGSDGRVCAVHRTGTVGCVAYAQSELRVTAVAGVLDAARVVVGAERACTIARDGVVRCWGHDVDGMVDGRTGAVEVTGLP